MRLSVTVLAFLLGTICLLSFTSAAQHNADIEDNDFAEFEDLGDEDEVDEMMVELEMEDAEDEDEFMMDRDDGILLDFVEGLTSTTAFN